MFAHVRRSAVVGLSLAIFAAIGVLALMLWLLETGAGAGPVYVFGAGAPVFLILVYEAAGYADTLAWLAWLADHDDLSDSPFAIESPAVHPL